MRALLLPACGAAFLLAATQEPQEPGRLVSERVYHLGDDETPLWSPDGQELAFISNQDGNAEVYLMTADGGRPVRITAEELTFIAEAIGMTPPTVAQG